MQETERRPITLSTLLLLALCLAGCGGKDDEPPAAASAPLASTGQVAAIASYKVSHYAASRFAEQASFGPTPALVQELRTKGFEKWIDEQFALAPSTMDTSVLEDYSIDGPVVGNVLWDSLNNGYQSLWLTAPDQLRLRVSWSLSQFIVISTRKVDVANGGLWFNLLQRQALGNYGDLLQAVSTNAGMGVYLDNNQNRPKSSDCPFCAPNENFARELMQLFTLGVFKLNGDGTPQRTARGTFVETYSQTDVEQLARALTGWQIDPEPQNRPSRNWGNWARPMIPTTWPPERDSGQKLVLGRVFPAGQSAEKDLQDAIALLTSHPNIAPFVSLRMIQHLVKSNPTPAYVGRVAARFRDNGSGRLGDMKAVVKAVLLDPEARTGDDPAAARADDGKLREPVLHRLASLRALGCRKPPLYPYGGVSTSGNQPPFQAESVFSFYAPADRAPGSNLLAPEQKLTTSREFQERLNQLNYYRWNDKSQTNSMAAYGAAGCSTDALIKAFASSPRAFSDHVSERFFRGAMPPTLRSNLEQQMLQPYPPWDRTQPDDGALRMLSYALSTPYYGAIK